MWHTQAKLTAAEAELDQLRAMISAARERDAFRVAYRHLGSLDDRVAVTALRAQSWPRDMQEVFSRCVIRTSTYTCSLYTACMYAYSMFT